jgi:cell division protein FtsB
MFNYYSKYLPKFKFERLDDAYDYIIGIFEDNKAKIDTIIQNKYIKMILYPNYEKEIELTLSFNKENKDFIKAEIIKLKNDMNELKTENKNLKRDITILKSYHNNAKDIDLLSDISTDSFAHSAITNTFLTFKAINETLYLIYATLDNSIICYDIEKQKKIRELKNYHSEFITNFRY